MNWAGRAALLCAFLPVYDAVVRLLLVRASRRFAPSPSDAEVRKWLVLIPSRAEGAHLELTLASVRTARGERSVHVLVILDGEDSEARHVAASHGAEVLLKETAGPGKAAVLCWAARHAANAIGSVDAVLLLDVGSRLSSRFFEAFRWPSGAAAVQSFLAGTGDGVGTAIAVSERFAQGVEDEGRQQLGWNVRLRGTGTAFRPAIFDEIATALRTHAEDLEASLLLASRGHRAVLGSADAVVYDEKPASIAAAAVQRARWLAGAAVLVVRRSGTLLRFCVRRPAEGFAFVAHCFGRPLTLTAAARLAAAVVLLVARRDAPVFSSSAAAVIVLSIISDFAVVRSAVPVEVPAAGRLVSAWFLAVPILPRAVMKWLRARR